MIWKSEPNVERTNNFKIDTETTSKLKFDKLLMP